MMLIRVVYGPFTILEAATLRGRVPLRSCAGRVLDICSCGRLERYVTSRGDDSVQILCLDGMVDGGGNFTWLQGLGPSVRLFVGLGSSFLRQS